LAREDAGEELRRSGEDEVGPFGGALVGVDLASAGFDGNDFVAGAELDREGGFVGRSVAD
jgi:hypothetical protein